MSFSKFFGAFFLVFLIVKGAFGQNASCNSFLSISEIDIRVAQHILRDYTRSGYIKINKAIRENPNSEESVSYIRTINFALDHLPNFEGLVYRGINHSEETLRWIDSLNEGDVFTWYTPTSTSSEQRIGRAFGPIRFTIKARTAKSVQAFALYAGVGINEHEYLLKPGTKFRVLSVEVPFEGKINRMVYIEEIDF